MAWRVCEIETVAVLSFIVGCEQGHIKSGASEEDRHRETTTNRWITDCVLRSHLHQFRHSTLFLLLAKVLA